jgi:hypothetical protein
MNNSRYHAAEPGVLPYECAVIRLSYFGETGGKRNFSRPETLSGHRSGKPDRHFA